jgi:hypothetical protein
MLIFGGLESNEQHELLLPAVLVIHHVVDQHQNHRQGQQ